MKAPKNTEKKYWKRLKMRAMKSALLVLERAAIALPGKNMLAVQTVCAVLSQVLAFMDRKEKRNEFKTIQANSRT